MTITNGLTSIHGRKLMLHKSGYVLAQDQSVTAASTSANLPAGGVSYDSATAATTYTLDAPIPGVRKEFWLTSTSTLAKKVVIASGNLHTSTGANKALTFRRRGQGFSAIGVTTAIMQVIEHKSTSALTTG